MKNMSPIRLYRDHSQPADFVLPCRLEPTPSGDWLMAEFWQWVGGSWQHVTLDEPVVVTAGDFQSGGGE